MLSLPPRALRSPLHSFACACSPDWTGKTCEDPCSGASCAIEAQCLNNGIVGNLSSSCYCPYPWTGSRCQEYDYCSISASTHDGLPCEKEVVDEFTSAECS